MKKEKALISACLIGERCRYDGKTKKVEGILGLAKYYDLIPICPEREGGLKIPRDPSEIQKDGSVKTQSGKDVTENYKNGAWWARSIAEVYNVKLAILKENSPSCGVHSIHTGLFDGGKIPGQGITAETLSKHGIKCINEDEARELLKSLDDKKNK